MLNLVNNNTMLIFFAGAIGILAFTAGIISYIILPRYEALCKEGNEKINIENISPAKGIGDLFRKSNWKQLLFLVIFSLVCGAAGYFSLRSAVDIIALCKQLALLIMLFSIFIIDSKTHLIPNIHVLILLGIGVISLVFEFIFNRDIFTAKLLMSVIGFVVCLVIFYIMGRITRDGIGMGDIKLIAAIGWLIGLYTTVVVLLFSLVLCTFAALFLIFANKKNRRDTVAFGPFLFFGYIITLMLFSI